MFAKSCLELKLRFIWMSIGYALVALVVYLSVTSNPVDTGMEIPYMDKFFHMLAYFVLMAWFAQIYHDKLRRNIIALIFIAMGIALEYVQSFDPARMFEFEDMVANTAGVALAYFLTLTRAKNCIVFVESWFG